MRTCRAKVSIWTALQISPAVAVETAADSLFKLSRRTSIYLMKLGTSILLGFKFN